MQWKVRSPLPQLLAVGGHGVAGEVPRASPEGGKGSCKDKC